MREEIPETAASRLAMSGPPVQLFASLVRPTALVLLELMSNAARHGALSRLDGRVGV